MHELVLYWSQKSYVTGFYCSLSMSSTEIICHSWIKMNITTDIYEPWLTLKQDRTQISTSTNGYHIFTIDIYTSILNWTYEQFRDNISEESMINYETGVKTAVSCINSNWLAERKWNGSPEPLLNSNHSTQMTLKWLIW